MTFQAIPSFNAGTRPPAGRLIGKIALQLSLWAWMAIAGWAMAGHTPANAQAETQKPVTPEAGSTPDHRRVAVLDGNERYIELAGRSYYWVDATGQWTVNQVESQADTLPFAVREPGHRVHLGQKAAMWVRFTTLHPDLQTHYELELARTSTDAVSLYYRNADGTWHEQHAGDVVPVARWPSPDRHPVFELDSERTGSKTYWVRIQHARVPFSGEFRILGQVELREERMTQQFMLGAYFGMAILLATVALVNSMVFRDSAFIAYSVYIALLGLCMAAGTGVGGQFIWRESAFINSRAEFVLLPMVAVGGLLFLRHVVQARRIGRWLNFASIVLSAIWLGLTLWDQIIPSEWSFKAINLAGSATLALVWAMVWTAWRTGDRWVRWIGVGILPVLLAGLIPVLRNVGMLPSNFLSQYGMVLAAAFEAPILFYGLQQRSASLREAQTRAGALTVTEPLTGLTNRHNFMLRLHDSLVRAQRYRHRCALLLVELNNHPWFVAEHDREMADRALVLAGSQLRSVARDVDTAARVSEQQFALLMEGPVRPAQAVAAATGLLARGLRPTPQLPVGASLKFKIVVAMLPDEAMDFNVDAQSLLDMMADAMEDLHYDKQRSILTLNF